MSDDERRDDLRRETTSPARPAARRGRRLLSALVALGLALTLAGCQIPNVALPQGQQHPTSNEVDMGISSFRQSSLTIHAGQTVRFVNPTNGGGVHLLCVGANLKCAPTPGTPTALAGTGQIGGGVISRAGEPPLDVTFPQPGIYQVICTIHPGMIVTIIVK